MFGQRILRRTRILATSDFEDGRNLCLRRIEGILRQCLGVVFLLVFITGCVSSAEEYYNKGVKYGVQGKFEEAEKEFKRVLKIDQFYNSAKECLKLIEDVSKEKVEKKTAIHLFKGASYGRKGMYDIAILEHKRAVAINPNFAEAHYNLGIAYTLKGMYDAAIIEYKKAIAINPNFDDAHYNCGIVYHNKGMYDAAIIEYKKAIAINPNLADAYGGLGAIYHNKGMYDAAIIEHKKAIAVNPNLARAYSYLGMAYDRKGMYDVAILEYKKAIAINPNYADAYNNLAAAYYYEKQYKLAIKYCDKARKLGGYVHPDFLEGLKPYR